MNDRLEIEEANLSRSVQSARNSSFICVGVSNKRFDIGFESEYRWCFEDKMLRNFEHEVYVVIILDFIRISTVWATLASFLLIIRTLSMGFPDPVGDIEPLFANKLRCVETDTGVRLMHDFSKPCQVFGEAP